RGASDTSIRNRNLATLARLVDGQGATAHVKTVQLTDCAIGVLAAAHLDEAETARLTRRAIRHDLDLVDGPAVAREQLADLRFVRAKRKIPDIEPATHSRTPALPKKEAVSGPRRRHDPSRRRHVPGIRRWYVGLSFLYESTVGEDLPTR